MGIDVEDRFNLRRFLTAQETVIDTALAELKGGLKRSHWMWFMFPQIHGLGSSYNSRYYAIKSVEEATQFLQHPVIGKRLLECTEAVLAVEGRSASDIFGHPDDLKLKSSMTLFARVSEPGSVFKRVLDKYFQGEQDERTLQLLEETV